MAQFLEAPSFVSDSIGWSVFESAVHCNRVDVLRLIDKLCGLVDNRSFYSAFAYAFGNGYTEVFDYICQSRPNWTLCVDQALKSLVFSDDRNNDACIALLRRGMPHAKDRWTFIALMHNTAERSSELFDVVYAEFCSRFERPNQVNVEELYHHARSLEHIHAFVRHFPPLSPHHANDIVRRSNQPQETAKLMRQYYPHFLIWI